MATLRPASCSASSVRCRLPSGFEEFAHLHEQHLARVAALLLQHEGVEAALRLRRHAAARDLHAQQVARVDEGQHVHRAGPHAAVALLAPKLRMAIRQAARFERRSRLLLLLFLLLCIRVVVISRLAARSGGDHRRLARRRHASARREAAQVRAAGDQRAARRRVRRGVVSGRRGAAPRVTRECGGGGVEAQQRGGAGEGVACSGEAPREHCRARCTHARQRVRPSCREHNPTRISHLRQHAWPDASRCSTLPWQAACTRAKPRCERKRRRAPPPRAARVRAHAARERFLSPATHAGAARADGAAKWTTEGPDLRCPLRRDDRATIGSSDDGVASKVDAAKSCCSRLQSLACS
jgi:hypothetical protein